MNKFAFTFLFLSSLSAAQTVSVPVGFQGQDRFIVSGDDIYDKKTDKTWKRCNYGQTWDNSNGWCRGVAKRLTVAKAASELSEIAGGWRVAELGEVLSILEIACAAIVAKSDTTFSEIHPYDWYLTATPHGNPQSIMAARCQGMRTDTAGLGSAYVSLIRIVRDGR